MRGHEICRGFVSFKKNVTIKTVKETMPSLYLDTCKNMEGIYEKYWHDKNYPYGFGSLFIKYTKPPYTRKRQISVEDKIKAVVDHLMKTHFSHPVQNWQAYQEAKGEEDIQFFHSLFQRWYEEPSKWIETLYPGEDSKRMKATFCFVLNEMHMKKIGKYIQ